MAYNYQGAIQAGANPSDVINYLSKQTGYNSQGALQAGANPNDVLRYMSNLPFKTAQPTTPTPPTDLQQIQSIQNPLGKAEAAVGKASGDTLKALTGQSGTPFDAVNPVGWISNAFNSAVGALGTGVKDLAGATTDKAATAIGGALRNIVGPEHVDAVMNHPLTQALIKTYTSPDTYLPLTAVGNTAALAGTVAGAKPLMESALPEVGQAVKDLTTPTEEQVNADIANAYNKAIKPTIAGKSTVAQVDKYNGNVQSAIKSIVDNKDNLQFTNDEGETTSRLPQSRHEFSDAIAQTKKSIFEQYDALQKQAGDQGASVDTKSIAQQLQPVIDNKNLALDPDRSNVITYAKQWQANLKDAGNLTTEGAQDLIKNLNDKLNAFYKNPTPEGASKASVDAMIANQLRTTLDKVINDSTGEEYAPLKKQYGALTSIEKDVTKAALRGAKANAKGLIDYTNIFTGSDLLKGLLTLDPASIVKGTAGRAITEFYKYLNNPDKGIQNMFEKAAKYTVPPPTTSPTTK